MYLMKDTNSRDDMLRPVPFGPGFTPREVAKATTMEIWGTSFSDAGPDYCLFKLIDEKGNVLVTKRILGY